MRMQRSLRRISAGSLEHAYMLVELMKDLDEVAMLQQAEGTQVTGG